MPCRCDDNCFAMSNRNGAWKHDKSTIRVAGKCSNALCNFGSIAHAGRYQPYAERWCGSLNGAQICSPCRIGRIKNHRNSVNTGRAFLKQLQPLPPDRKLEIGEAGDIALRPCQVGDEAGRDRIDNLHKNDRYRERVCCRKAVAASAPEASTTSGRSSISSVASVEMWAASTPPKRKSMRTLRPLTQPNSCRPCISSLIK